MEDRLAFDSLSALVLAFTALLGASRRRRCSPGFECGWSAATAAGKPYVRADLRIIAAHHMLLTDALLFRLCRRPPALLPAGAHACCHTPLQPCRS